MVLRQISKMSLHISSSKFHKPHLSHDKVTRGHLSKQVSLFLDPSHFACRKRVGVSDALFYKLHCTWKQEVLLFSLGFFPPTRCFSVVNKVLPKKYVACTFEPLLESWTVSFLNFNLSNFKIRSLTKSQK